jgi:hypothetical protein
LIKNNLDNFNICIMKEYVSIIIFVFLLCGCGGSSNRNSTSSTADQKKFVENDLTAEGLYGNIDSIRQRVYWAVERFGRLEKGRLQNMPAQDFLKVYNSDGFLIEEVRYNSNDVAVSRKLLSRDQSNRLIGEEIYRGTTLDETVVYTFNAENQLERLERFAANGTSKGYTIYYYYEDGNLMDEDIHRADGVLTSKLVYIYSEGKLSEKQRYWGGGAPAEKEYYQYDRQENLEMHTIERYQNRVPTVHRIYKFTRYDAYKNNTERVTYDVNREIIEEDFYVYDEHSNLLEHNPYRYRTVTHATTPVVSLVLEEDDYGNQEVVTQEEIVQEGEEFTERTQAIGAAYTYEYDDYSNWTIKVTYKIETDDTRTRQFYYERVIVYSE